MTQKYWRSVILTPLSLISLACGRADVVDLGGEGGPDIVRGARCPDSPVVAESVRVTQQSELEALFGCERVDGDLTVEFFAGADVAPLAYLREVRGAFVLGAYPEALAGEDSNDYFDRVALAEENIEQGYVTSLHGLEALERVGMLSLTGIGAPDLLALQSLRSVDSPGFESYGGILQVTSAANLVSLE